MTSLTGSFRLAEIRRSSDSFRMTDSITDFTASMHSVPARETLQGFPLPEAVAQVKKALTRKAVPDRTADEEVADERLNAITHGFGLAVSIVAFGWLLMEAVETGGFVRIAACGVYGISLVLMYTGSTALHLAVAPRWKLRFQVCDHVAIYLLIAGSYTPFLASLNNQLGWTLLGCVWMLASIGIAIKLRYATRLEETSPLPYVGLGWLALAVIKPLLATMPVAGLWLLVAGGVSYSAGVPFYCRDDKRYFHAIWHLFVMAGTGCHFAAILLYVAR